MPLYFQHAFARLRIVKKIVRFCFSEKFRDKFLMTPSLPSCPYARHLNSGQPLRGVKPTLFPQFMAV